MTQAVMVEDEGGTVRGMLNGSDYAKDSTHGRLIVAAGSEGSTAAQLSKANTRIYEDGHQVSNSLELKEGCTIGGSIVVTEDGIKIDQPSRSGYILLDDGGIFYNGGNTGVYASLGNCTGAAIQGIGKGGIAGCPDPTYQVGVCGASAESKAAFFAPVGQFYGLRPRTRDVSSGDTLDELDHNVFITGGTISLPLSPLKGQTYKIYHYATTALTIHGGGKNILQMKGSSLLSGATATSSQIEVIELVYGGVNWFGTINRWD